MTSRCTFEYEGRLYWSVLRLRPGQGPGIVISGGLSQALRVLAGLQTHSSGSFCATPGRTLRVVKSRVGARRTPRSILECHVSRACMFFVVFVHVDIRASCEHLVSILCASCCILCASLHVFFLGRLQVCGRLQCATQGFFAGRTLLPARVAGPPPC